MKFSELKGKTLTKIEVLDDERIVFTTDDGKAFASYHMQDCCESVGIHETRGNIDDVLGSPILEANEACDSEANKPGEYAESWTWTTQRLRTEKGELVFVWLGESNGYYGETPYFDFTHAQ